MNPATIVDLTAASGTLSQIGAQATPIFASTIQPSAFVMGIEVGGLIAAAVIGAVWVGIKYAFEGHQSDPNAWRGKYHPTKADRAVTRHMMSYDDLMAESL